MEEKVIEEMGGLCFSFGFLFFFLYNMKKHFDSPFTFFFLVGNKCILGSRFPSLKKKSDSGRGSFFVFFFS